MSGLVRGIGKVFKSVASAVKKIAVPALITGLIFATGGAALGAAPALGAGAGASASSGGVLSGFFSSIFGGGAAAAPAAGLGAAGAAAAAAAPAAAAGGGLMGTIGGLLSNPTVGSLISGAAQGWAAGAKMKEEEEQLIRAEERREARYEGVGDATRWGGGGAATSSSATEETDPVENAVEAAPRGLAVADERIRSPRLEEAAPPAPARIARGLGNPLEAAPQPINPIAPVVAQQPSAVIQQAQPPQQAQVRPRISYNPQTRRIEHA